MSPPKPSALNPKHTWSDGKERTTSVAQAFSLSSLTKDMSTPPMRWRPSRDTGSKSTSDFWIQKSERCGLRVNAHAENPMHHTTMTVFGERVSSPSDQRMRAHQPGSWYRASSEWSAQHRDDDQRRDMIEITDSFSPCMCSNPNPKP